ncbi:hypothetical protein DNI29_16280 [Hymenobacter sediminis]|uniref:hypothetical protein n=1 Tax=Hymenobacter sediminis TaxID=2218621 RepID=UPI000DA685BB|nr:hypothetical protein [Hymenobacter sediminis]RPD45714.1 hypothetical protein DNI29_16280 [Hymenobacter sediminis]
MYPSDSGLYFPTLASIHYTDLLYDFVELPAAVTDLLHTSPVQRLRSLHQGGAIVLGNPALNYTHFEHPVG